MNNPLGVTLVKGNREPHEVKKKSFDQVVIGQFVIGQFVIGQFVTGQFNKPITFKVVI